MKNLNILCVKALRNMCLTKHQLEELKQNTNVLAIEENQQTNYIECIVRIIDGDYILLDVI